RHFERAGMLAAQTGQRRRIQGRRGGDQRGRRQTGADRQSGAAEKIAAWDGCHSENYSTAARLGWRISALQQKLMGGFGAATKKNPGLDTRSGLFAVCCL